MFRYNREEVNYERESLILNTNFIAVKFKFQVKVPSRRYLNVWQITPGRDGWNQIFHKVLYLALLATEERTSSRYSGPMRLPHFSTTEAAIFFSVSLSVVLRSKNSTPWLRAASI